MKISIINTILLTIFLHLPTFSTLSGSSGININQAVIRDTSGSIEYKTTSAITWLPASVGIRIPTKHFIRLNTPESIITLELADGGLLRLIGIGSIYIDCIASAKTNFYQTKILLLSGRWFYSSNPSEKSRLVVNTDLITSIIENGSGGGLNLNGTNELIIRTGRGLISYREQEALALVLDERQLIKFYPNSGFEYPVLAKESDFQSYIIFDDALNSSTQNINNIQVNISPKDTFTLANYDQALSNQINELKKLALGLDQIDASQLQILSDLNYKKKNQTLQIKLSSVLTNKPKPAALPPIPPELLKPFAEDLDLNVIGPVTRTTKQAAKTANSEIKAPVITRPAKTTQKKPTQTKKKPAPVIAVDPTADELNNLLRNLENQASKESPPPKIKAPPKKTKSSPAPTFRQKARPPAKPKKIPKSTVIEEAPEEYIEVVPEEYIEEAPEEYIEEAPEIDPNFYSSDQFENELDESLFKYNKFNIQNANDLLNSEFNKVLFDI
ncbi:MAG: hypothetical protein ACRCTQ_02025 [Brevinemataceae bacterium]